MTLKTLRSLASTACLRAAASGAVSAPSRLPNAPAAIARAVVASPDIRARPWMLLKATAVPWLILDAYRRLPSRHHRP
jgi:hypothetical protein